MDAIRCPEDGNVMIPNATSNRIECAKCGHSITGVEALRINDKRAERS